MYIYMCIYIHIIFRCTIFILYVFVYLNVYKHTHMHIFTYLTIYNVHVYARYHI